MGMGQDLARTIANGVSLFFRWNKWALSRGKRELRESRSYPTGLADMKAGPVQTLIRPQDPAPLLLWRLEPGHGCGLSRAMWTRAVCWGWHSDYQEESWVPSVELRCLTSSDSYVREEKSFYHTEATAILGCLAPRSD